MTDKLKKIIHDYLESEIEDYDARISYAWHIIDRYRCPLSHADSSLWSDIECAVNNWLYDHNNINPNAVYDELEDIALGYYE